MPTADHGRHLTRRLVAASPRVAAANYRCCLRSLHVASPVASAPAVAPSFAAVAVAAAAAGLALAETCRRRPQSAACAEGVGRRRGTEVVGASDVYDGDRLLWAYVNEGGLNMILRYIGTDRRLGGRVLRLRKGDGGSRRLAEDAEFQRRVVAPLLGKYLEPGRVVQLDSGIIDRINCDDAIQGSRSSKRRAAKIAELDSVGGADGGVCASLCPDLTFCPRGVSYEIKLKNGVDECAELGVYRFALMQVAHCPKKHRTLSTYNPVEFCSGVLEPCCPARLLDQLRKLRAASEDAAQNNFRVLGDISASSAASDEDLDDLALVLRSAPALFRRLRALNRLASGLAVEAAVLRASNRAFPAGCKGELTTDHFAAALADQSEGARLLELLDAVEDDAVALRLVAEAYERMDPISVLALFLLGRTINDCSVIVNVCRLALEDDVAWLGSLRYAEVDPASKLWGRLTVVDTDIKPTHKVRQYATSLSDVVGHENSQKLISCVNGGVPVDRCLQRLELELNQR
eukprot:TRINITY_DN22715_c0_g2_i1.p1 TRINITY_DN22715_c0_g2~~TRINITY_DN22715_c0_g2_i1.p1  ORF type:complete len:528 (-),score=118.01 TRINITY_DN22715_c0_g2_i1:72-1622(-)